MNFKLRYHSELPKFLYRKIMISNCKFYKINEGSMLRISFEHFLFYGTLSSNLVMHCYKSFFFREMITRSTTSLPLVIMDDFLNISTMPKLFFANSLIKY